MDLVSVVAGVFIFLMTVTVHEYCHGLLADRLGDPTARQAGRLTLNPLRHLDPFWTVLLPLLLFVSTRGQFAIGMARPVPVNFLNLRNPQRDMVWVGAAGPFANFLLAAALAGLYRVWPSTLLLYAVYFNVGIGVFNLFPVPPLDGSRILAGLLPTRLAAYYMRLEPYGFLLVMALYFSGLLYAALVPGIHFFCRLLGVPELKL